MDVYAEPVEPFEKRRRPKVARAFALGAGAGFATLVACLAAIPKDGDPEGSRVQQVLSILGSGDRAAARSATNALLSELPDEPRAWIVDGALKELENDLEGAERSYRRAHALSPNDPARRSELEVSFAELRRRRGDPAGALAALGSIEGEGADPVRRIHAAALCFIDLGRFDEALNAARAIAEKPYGAGVARRLEQDVRTRRDAPESRDG